ncbi:MAG: UV DNA damage repair endonuclease UvsE [Deltaproteobacteria bacterium]|nr:UV DNA damage repair endonuclease UvsE [Deltaproteobacteria bacterium]TLN00741.1 MAG: UV DNA damage repair endonuclease UvsE [bacterium]
MRFGLCCIFMNEPIRFRTTTARFLTSLSRAEQLERLSAICLENAKNLYCAIETVARLGIGAFRVSSPFFPRYTHPEVGYTLEELPAGAEIRTLLYEVDQLRSRLNIRLSFHPDQFVSISSLRDEVMRKSLEELEYQGLVAELIGADVITIHAGGRQGGKSATLQRFMDTFPLLSERVRVRLALENDDISYTVKDLLPVCEQLDIPLVYDVHHHRCNPDGLPVEEATNRALATWQRQGREPWVHISSPRNGWGEGNAKLHADYIDPADFPEFWRELDVTIDVEAKAKELAVLRLMNDLVQQAGDILP